MFEVLRGRQDGQFNGMSAGQAYCFTDVGPFARYPNQGLFEMRSTMAVGGNWIGDPRRPARIV